MNASLFEVVGRPIERPSVQPNARSQFTLRPLGRLPASHILTDPHITLFGIDLESGEAVFVETPAEVDLSHASFYFHTQFETALRVLTLPFAGMVQLSRSIPVDDSRLIHIYSVGRCGSTLASQIFAQVPGVVNISEPAVLSQLVIARNTSAAGDQELIDLLEASVRLLCKTPAGKAWVLKGQSFVIELGDWLHQLFPRTRNLFLYRDARSWLRSGLRAYSAAAVGLYADDPAQRAAQRRGLLGTLVPAIGSYDLSLPLLHAGMLSLMWLTAMERYVQHCDAGMEMLAIRYASWLSAPRQTAAAMLDYCRCRPAEMTAVYAALERDSQADTPLSRETLQQQDRTIADHEFDELHFHLERHPFIHDPDYEVANTLKL